MLFGLLVFVGFSLVYAYKIDDFVIMSRLFKTTEQHKEGDSDVVVSLYSVPVLIPYHPTYIQLEKINIYRLMADLQKIYKIDDIDHLSSGLLIWDGKKTQLNGIIMVKESSYPLMFYPSIIDGGGLNLRVQVSRPRGDPSDRMREENLLDTEMVMRFDSPYVLGFPSNGSRYFLSISIAKKDAGKFRQDEYSQAAPEEDIPQTPSPIHKIIPAYPPHLKLEGIGGKVIMQVGIDKQGSVTQVKILNSVHPDLEKAAALAVEQWKFAPVMKKNKPVSAKFPVIVEFKAPGVPSDENAADRK